MNTRAALSWFGKSALGIVMLLAFLALPALFVVGAATIGVIVLPWLMLLSATTFGLCVVAFAPLALIQSTRHWGGFAFLFSSYVFGLTGWFMGLLLAWMLWGLVAVLFGLFLFGVGVVPVAMLATLFNGMWLELGMLTLCLVCTFGSRFLGAMLLSE